MRLLTTIVAQRDARQPVHRVLQSAWAPKRDAVGDVIRTALVLCADHELNVSAFTARCAASAGASPYDIVSAAMATLKGYGTGERRRGCVRCWRESGHAKERRGPGCQSIAAWRRTCRGSAILCYPSGDPRAVLLMQLAEASGNEAEWRPIRNLQKGQDRSCCTTLRTWILAWPRWRAPTGCPNRLLCSSLRWAERSAGSLTRSRNMRQAS